MSFIPISGETGVTYLQEVEVEGLSIRVVETTNGVSANSNSIGPVAPAPPISTSLLAIGTTQGENGWEVGLLPTPDSPAGFTTAYHSWNAGGQIWQGAFEFSFPYFNVGTQVMRPRNNGDVPTTMSMAARYTFSEAGEVDINANGSVVLGTSGGVALRIWHNSTEVMELYMDGNTIPNASNEGSATITVAIGDTILVELDPTPGSGGAQGDQTAVAVTIASSL